MRIAVLTIAVGTAAVCWMAVALVFGGRLHYFTEHTTNERMNGVVDRLNSEPLYQSDDGAVNEGYFLVDRGIQQRIVLPEDWDGEFGTVDLPAVASDLPNDFLDLVQLVSCGRNKAVQLYVEGDTFFEVVFLDFTGRPVERIWADSKAC